MTREQKIQNILTATKKVIEEEVANGTMTPEKYAFIIENQNSAILAITD